MTETPSDDQGIRDDGPPPEVPEAQRNLGAVLSQIGVKAVGGVVGGAAAWATKKALDKKFGDRPPDDKDGGGQEPGPPEVGTPG